MQDAPQTPGFYGAAPQWSLWSSPKHALNIHITSKPYWRSLVKGCVGGGDMHAATNARVYIEVYPCWTMFNDGTNTICVTHVVPIWIVSIGAKT